MRLIHLLMAEARLMLVIVAIRISRRLATLGEWLFNLGDGAGRPRTVSWAAGPSRGNGARTGAASLPSAGGRG
jgi:hypothetical protein